MAKTIYKNIINSNILTTEEKIKYLSVLDQNELTVALIDSLNGNENELATTFLKKKYNKPYFTEYYTKNKDTIKGKSLNYYYSNKEELNEKCKKRYHKNKENKKKEGSDAL